MKGGAWWQRLQMAGASQIKSGEAPPAKKGGPGRGPFGTRWIDAVARSAAAAGGNDGLMRDMEMQAKNEWAKYNREQADSLADLAPIARGN